MKKEEIKFDVEYKEDTELWVNEVDKDKEDLEFFREEKIKKSKKYSWILVTIILFLLSLLGESILYSLGRYLFIKEISITILVWIWRIVLINIFLYISYFKMHLKQERLFIITIIAFVLSVIVSITYKILFINSAWVYLNLLVEPIWIILMIVLVGSLYSRFIYKN